MPLRRRPICSAVAAAAAAVLPGAAALPWMRAKVGQSCEEACMLGCWNAEQQSLTTPQAVQHALSQVRSGCDRFTIKGCSAADGGMPSLEDVVAKCKTELHDSPIVISIRHDTECVLEPLAVDKDASCSAQPPGGTARVCACAPFDCMAGLPNWQAGWAPQKKEWCCAHRGLACKADEQPAPKDKDAYDCGDWDQVWSLGQHKYCCSAKGIGCLEISNVSGKEAARFASGSLTLEARRPHAFVSNSNVVTILRNRVAHVVGVEPIQVSMELVATRSLGMEAKQQGLRSADGAAELSFTVPILEESDHKAAMRIAGFSADEWADELRRALDAGGYAGDFISVLSVGEVALSTERTVPMEDQPGDRSIWGMILLFVAAVALVVIVTVMSMPPSRKEVPNSPDGSPSQSKSFLSLAQEEGVASPLQRANHHPLTMVVEGSKELTDDLVEIDAFDLYFKTLSFKFVDHAGFKASLIEGLLGLGAPASDMEHLDIALRHGSLIARLSGPASLIAALRALPLQDLEIEGCRPVRLEGAAQGAAESGADEGAALGSAAEAEVAAEERDEDAEHRSKKSEEDRARGHGRCICLPRLKGGCGCGSTKGASAPSTFGGKLAAASGVPAESSPT